MVKLPGFENLSLEKLKQMGSDLVESLSASEGGTKPGLDILPSDVKAKMDQVVLNLSDLLKAQELLNQAISTLKGNINSLCETSIAMCALKVEEGEAKDVAVKEQVSPPPAAVQEPEVAMQIEPQVMTEEPNEVPVEPTPVIPEPGISEPVPSTEKTTVPQETDPV